MHREGSVAVTAYLSGYVADVVDFLENNGGDPRNVGEDYIEAYVPVTLLGELSRTARRTAGAGDHAPAAGSGWADHRSRPPLHGSQIWNWAGYSGQGVKVGVIDVFSSFNGFRELMGTELPSTVKVKARCYIDVGAPTSNLANCESKGNHGTIVAETVLDIAPEVDLYIADPRTPGDLSDTVDWDDRGGSVGS